MKKEKVCILGTAGYVGTTLSLYLAKNFTIFTPVISELDASDEFVLKKYLNSHPVKTLINLVAHTDLAQAEKERGNKTGLTWKLNVSIPDILARLCKSLNIHFVHISTDAVFPGTDDNPGPYHENAELISGLEKYISWYGFTKSVGEHKVVQSGCSYTIIRIAYPFGGGPTKDLIKKIINYTENGTALFGDQTITPTYLPDFNKATLTSIKENITGVLHVACKPPTTFFEIAEFIKGRLSLEKDPVRGSVIDFNRQPDMPPRAVYGGLLCDESEKKLNLRFSNWRVAVDKTLESIA